MSEHHHPTHMAVSLPQGRRLSFAEYGDLDGFPVFHFHGGNSSRLEGQWLDQAARASGVRLLAPDRPGVGYSDPQPGRKFLDWPQDVAALADHLKLDTFAVMGLSGGGPHAAACAFSLPERVTAAAIVSGTAPPEMPERLRGMFFPLRLNFLAAQHAPFLSRFFLSQMGGTYTDPERFLNMVKMGMPKPDADLAEKLPQVIHQFAQSAVESHRQGIEADIEEWQLYVQPWGFNLEDITVPVSLWFGEFDTFVPLAMGRYQHGRIPGSSLHVVPDGGHFSTIVNHAGSIFKGLKATAR